MTLLDALQTTLAAEHAAVYVHGVLGARTSASSSPALFAALTDAYAAHRGRRDQLVAFVLDEGGIPVASEATYVLPAPLGTTAEVAGAALDVERSCAETYGWLVASSTGRRRRWAVQALENAAVRGLTFRGSPEIFPGAGEYADH